MATSTMSTPVHIPIPSTTTVAGEIMSPQLPHPSSATVESGNNADADVELPPVSVTNVTKCPKSPSKFKRQSIDYSYRLPKNQKNAVPGLVQMKRCFISGAVPALSPGKSRLVEAICIYLTQKHATSATTSVQGEKK